MTKAGATHSVEIETLRAQIADLERQLAAAREESRLLHEQLLAEQRLRESETRYDAAFRASPAIMAISELHTGRLVDVNARAVEALGYSREEMIGRTSLELGIWLRSEQREALVARLAATGRSEHDLVQFVTKDGVRRDLEWSASLLAVSGTPLMLTLLVDVTERRNMERTLATKDEYFRQLVLNSGDVISVVDRQGTTTAIFGATGKLFGVPPESHLKYAAQDRVHPDDVPELRRHIEGILATPRATTTITCRYRHADGRWVPIEVVATNLLDDPIVCGIVLNSRDLSERVRAESERAKLEGRLQQAAKMEAIGRLAGGVAHDFNNILTVISGNIDLARADYADRAAHDEHLTHAENAAESAASLTRQLLAFSRQQPVEPKLVELNAIIRDTERMLRRVIGEDVELCIALNGGGFVRIDPAQLEQILFNLVANARDAMPNGGKLVIETTRLEVGEDFCRSHPTAKPGQYVLLSVADSGEGIAREIQQHIFEPFFTTKRVGHGTGLGLATVFGIVDQLGGAIDVYSEIGLGTTFKVYLPAVEEVVGPRASQPSPSVPAPARGETVLLVEDDPPVRVVALAFLTQLGYRTQVVASASEALGFLERDPTHVDLLFTDLVMPGMNGRELADRAVALRPSMRVLFTSGYAEAVVTHKQMLEKGAHFLSKPYSRQSLSRKLREALD